MRYHIPLKSHVTHTPRPRLSRIYFLFLFIYLTWTYHMSEIISCVVVFLSFFFFRKNTDIYYSHYKGQVFAGWGREFWQRCAVLQDNNDPSPHSGTSWRWSCPCWLAWTPCLGTPRDLRPRLLHILQHHVAVPAVGFHVAPELLVVVAANEHLGVFLAWLCENRQWTHIKLFFLPLKLLWSHLTFGLVEGAHGVSGCTPRVSAISFMLLVPQERFHSMGILNCIHPHIDGHLVCFHLLSIVNNATIIIQA